MTIVFAIVAVCKCVIARDRDCLEQARDSRPRLDLNLDDPPGYAEFLDFARAQCGGADPESVIEAFAQRLWEESEAPLADVPCTPWATLKESNDSPSTIIAVVALGIINRSRLATGFGYDGLYVDSILHLAVRDGHSKRIGNVFCLSMRVFWRDLDSQLRRPNFFHNFRDA